MAVSVAVAVGDIGDKLVEEINNKAQTAKSCALDRSRGRNGTCYI